MPLTIFAQSSMLDVCRASGNVFVIIHLLTKDLIDKTYT